MDIKSHPLMQQIQADVDKANRTAADERMLADMEATRLRQAQGQLLNREYLAAVERYEVKRKELHAAAGDLWLRNQDYARVTGQNAPTFMESSFMQIDTPSMVPPTSHWATMNSGVGTVRTAVANYFATRGQWS